MDKLLTHQDKFGRTALHYAADRGCIDVLTELLELGADPNAEDMYGITPFQVALMKWDLSVISVFLDHDAESSDSSDDEADYSSCPMECCPMRCCFAKGTPTVKKTCCTGMGCCLVKPQASDETEQK